MIGDNILTDPLIQLISNQTTKWPTDDRSEAVIITAQHQASVPVDNDVIDINTVSKFRFSAQTFNENIITFCSLLKL